MTKATTKDARGPKVIASNRRARHDFEILETHEAGIVLKGGEVKALRDGRVQLADAYAHVQDGELVLHGVHISPYVFATGFGAYEPKRPRKLLMHKREIETITARVQQQHLALVPLSLYFVDGRVKVELAVAKGRTKGDKRHALAERDAKKEIERAMGRVRKGRA